MSEHFGSVARSGPLLASAATLLFATTCAAQGESYETARSRWDRASLDTYEYGYQKYCECHPETPPETIVTVRDGEVVGVRHRPVGSSSEVEAQARNLEFYWTIAGLFELLASALSRGAQVRADFDATLGHPTSIWIDYDHDFIGDELDLRITRVDLIER
jgi:Family of unknown function (DUF6174)